MSSAASGIVGSRMCSPSDHVSFIFSSYVHQPWYFHCSPNYIISQKKSRLVSMDISSCVPSNGKSPLETLKEPAITEDFLRETPGNHHSKIIWGWVFHGFSMVFHGFPLVTSWYLGHSPEIPSKQRASDAPSTRSPAWSNVLRSRSNVRISDFW